MARVLVVDDEQACRVMLYLGLREAGHEVHTAATAREALASAPSIRPDHLVIDLRLNDTMCGLELARRLLLAVPGARVILVTGWGGPLDLGDLPAILVEKPVEGFDLLERVVRALEVQAA